MISVTVQWLIGNHLSEDEVERMSGKTPQHTNIAPNMASNASTRVDPERKAIKDSKDKQTARGRHFDIRFSMVAWQAKDQDQVHWGCASASTSQSCPWTWNSPGGGKLCGRMLCEGNDER